MIENDKSIYQEQPNDDQDTDLGKKDNIPEPQPVDYWARLRAIGFVFGKKEDEGPFWKPLNKSGI